ncbi:hypothetical protein ACIRD8_15090 [Streptomyces sp. NPDC102451]|uniref:hypothetical protein n=1 Tax=Streptomyces sp. NPDC102451 TaxID=3366177 RepID=UPI00381ADB71
MTKYKEVKLICGGPGCSEGWTHKRPVGKRGPNPRTNPAHSRCDVKRQNKNRKMSRVRKETGAETFYWNIRKVSDVPFGDMTKEEQTLYIDAMNRPWWPIGTVQDLPEEGWEVRQIVPESAQPAWKCSDKGDTEKVQRWLHESGAKVASGCEVGRTTEKARVVIGSAEPWNTIHTHRDVSMGAMEPMTTLEPFTLIL